MKYLSNLLLGIAVITWLSSIIIPTENIWVMIKENNLHIIAVMLNIILSFGLYFIALLLLFVGIKINPYYKA